MSGKRILIIYTGGTIGMMKTELGYAPQKEAFHQLLDAIPELKSGSMPDWDVIDMDPLLDSSNMTVKEWNMIGSMISDHYDRYDGFVILHGTDTMAYTSSVLSFTLRNNRKPVILTGSQIPLCELRNDARGNPVPELHRGGYTFRPGDKVMQIRNNYDKEVFNGDIGTIESMNPNEKTLSIRFDDRSVEYDVSELDEIVLAYATTVHKAQGAEYPLVVMPVMMTHFTMLQRNLLYTGVTRAKKTLVLVGQKKAVGYCVRNVTVYRRNTLLVERLAGKI